MQYPNKVNLWAGIIDQHVIGPSAICGALNAPKYLDLENEISVRLTDLGLGADL